MLLAFNKQSNGQKFHEDVTYLQVRTLVELLCFEEKSYTMSNEGIPVLLKEYITLVGPAFSSASAKTLIDRITSNEFRDFLRNRKLKVSLFGGLKVTLLMLEVVLNDAEEKQVTNGSVKEWLEHWGMNAKLEAISSRLEHFAKQKDILGVQSVSSRGIKTATTSLVNESAVVGREDDKEKLLNMLLFNEDAKDNDIGLITIWGMGGVGKTTLAQLLYNDKEVGQHFDLKARACVSNKFNVFDVTKNLVESVTSKVYHNKNLDLLRFEPKNCLTNKKFLLVLDDIWNDKYSDWDDLVTPFRCGRRGSKIIVTTHQQRVAEITRTFPVYNLTPLSNENCWHLLAKHALRNEDPNKYTVLEAIGKKIARKCGGLPIAAKTVGGLLRSKEDAEERNKILNSNLWDLPNDDVLPALCLSYLYLPSHLKQCFAYCSIFPKDLVLDKKQLTLLWMAEGFVQQYSHGEKALETQASDCFNELLSRPFFQQYEGDPRKFVMHDLINDLAKFVSGRSCLWFEGNEIPKSVPPDLFSKLKWLRALSLSGYYSITELPNSIGNLQHLRYLDLSYTSITRLPDSSFTLYNLQTLLLSYCLSFNDLPGKIEKLINLRHLDISGIALKEMPTQISKLQNLYNLSTFGKVVDCMDAYVVNLKRREKIEELVLEWDCDTQDSRVVKDVLDMLQPSRNLQRLTVNYYGGTSFPNWVGNSSFTNITFLSISDCNYCLSLPPFGQPPSLKELLIKGITLIHTVSHEFYCSKTESSSFQPFRILKSLRFEKMPVWEEWIPFEVKGTKFPFPCLKHLYLYDCPMFKGDIPNNLPSLTKVDILKCNQLKVKSSALQCITSIEELNIELGEQGLLRTLDNDSPVSLKCLRIEVCYSLQSFAKIETE
ncbi:putative disease resistance RPP13-like protein 1 [Prosopis cineraria]|uniref:putative disease resistance RPP13-like protein 1 n=1 Tax=Prosopis cineraria TaxID=364024 RepID=UPI00240F2191|nr:putative disease resistance RPP13-like protein 1 [Prosopis cineraria]